METDVAMFSPPSVHVMVTGFPSNHVRKAYIQQCIDNIEATRTRAAPFVSLRFIRIPAVFSEGLLPPSPHTRQAVKRAS
jgi:hypothetical protein